MTHDAIYLREACRVAAAESHDLRTQNGALLRAKDGQIITAANQFPPIIRTQERQSNANKYSYIEHAERHVVYRAAQAGICTKGATLYCPWFACAECARAIILSGVSRVVGHVKPRLLTPERWRQTIEIADQMFNEAGLDLLFIDDKLDVKFLFDDNQIEL